MNEPSSPRRILHLVVEGLPPAGMDEIRDLTGASDPATEVLVLTEMNAREALEKIFEADTVTVWGSLQTS